MAFLNMTTNFKMGNGLTAKQTGAMAAAVSSYIIAVLFINMGTQAIQVTNLAIIYSLDEKANSRINTVYMTSYFMGGAIGTLAGVLSWINGRWQLVTWQLLIWSILALLLILSGKRKEVLNIRT
jgi:O-antigen/teichoic acid export membrane protein